MRSCILITALFTKRIFLTDYIILEMLRFGNVWMYRLLIYH